jgi:hypothetical protein
MHSIVFIVFKGWARTDPVTSKIYCTSLSMKWCINCASVMVSIMKSFKKILGFESMCKMTSPVETSWTTV